MMIPNILHFVQLGANTDPLSDCCIKSWEKFFPKDSWQWRRWTEDNISELGIVSQYFEEALIQKKYAFASDVIRFHALMKYGGIYLDTDVEVIRSFTPLLSNEAFLASENIAVKTYNAAVVGGRANHPLWKDVCEFYDKQDGQQFFAIPYVLTKLIQHNKYVFSDLPPQSFYPYNPFDQERLLKQLMYSDITMDTYAIHHWNQSWLKANDNKLSILNRLVRKIKRELLW